MSYVLTDGKGYISRMRGGKTVVTYDFDLATKYPTETHALEFLSSLNKSYNQKGHRPKKVEAKEKQLPPPEKQKLEPVRGKIAESEELTQLRNHLIMIDQILGSLKDLYSKKIQRANRSIGFSGRYLSCNRVHQRKCSPAMLS